MHTVVQCMAPLRLNSSRDIMRAPGGACRGRHVGPSSFCTAGGICAERGHICERPHSQTAHHPNHGSLALKPPCTSHPCSEPSKAPNLTGGPPACPSSQLTRARGGMRAGCCRMDRSSWLRSTISSRLGRCGPRCPSSSPSCCGCCSAAAGWASPACASPSPPSSAAPEGQHAR